MSLKTSYLGEDWPGGRGWGVLDTNCDGGARLEVLDPDPVQESFAPENGTHV